MVDNLPVNVSQEVIKKINEGAGCLSAAYAMAVQKNGMAADLPCFQRLMELQKELGTVMQQISKVRGL